ncbi:MAG: GntR family transcriptional regulator [Pararhodobacter sp.]|nr:GntR family transcriptional regulator [Pararhodobacter sp.]
MKIQAFDISRAASATTIVFDALRQAIIKGDLKEGEHLRQDEIARAFNVSRIPVREALLKLEQHGLVRTQRYKGAVVSGLSLDEASEIFDFRALLEPEVIRHAVPRMTQTVLEEARTFCEAFARDENPMNWGDLNRRFHSTLYEASGLSFHMEVLNNALDRVEPYLRAQLLLSDGMDRANREHRGILEACAAGDGERAAELTRAHIQGARNSLQRRWQG